jgi:hypothetical protein
LRHRGFAATELPALDKPSRQSWLSDRTLPREKFFLVELRELSIISPHFLQMRPTRSLLSEAIQNWTRWKWGIYPTMVGNPATPDCQSTDEASHAAVYFEEYQICRSCRNTNFGARIPAVISKRHVVSNQRPRIGTIEQWSIYSLDRTC